VSRFCPTFAWNPIMNSTRTFGDLHVLLSLLKGGSQNSVYLRLKTIQRTVKILREQFLFKSLASKKRVLVAFCESSILDEHKKSIQVNVLRKGLSFSSITDVITYCMNNTLVLIPILAVSRSLNNTVNSRPSYLGMFDRWLILVFTYLQ